MLNRKTTPPDGAGRNRRRDARRGAGAKSTPERRRFVIASSSRRDISKSTEANGKRTHTASSIAEAEKRLQNGGGDRPGPHPIHGGPDRNDQDLAAPGAGAWLHHLRRHQRRAAGQSESRRPGRVAHQTAQPGRRNRHGPGGGGTRQAARARATRGTTGRGFAAGNSG